MQIRKPLIITITVGLLVLLTTVVILAYSGLADTNTRRLGELIERDATTYTDEDLHFIAQMSAANQLTHQELRMLRDGMSPEQIEKVREYIQLYPKTAPDSRSLPPTPTQVPQ